jgi:hypothetical protein
MRKLSIRARNWSAYASVFPIFQVLYTLSKNFKFKRDAEHARQKLMRLSSLKD